MTPTTKLRAEIVGHLKGEPVFALDALDAPAPRSPRSVADVLNTIVDLIEELDAIHAGIIQEIRDESAIPATEMPAEAVLSREAVLHSMNVRAAVAGLTLIHLKAVVGTANQVLG